jgi:hypothetical protein
MNTSVIHNRCHSVIIAAMCLRCVYLGRVCIGRRPVCLCGFGCVRVFVCCVVMLRVLIPFSS